MRTYPNGIRFKKCPKQNDKPEVHNFVFDSYIKNIYEDNKQKEVYDITYNERKV